METLFYLLVGVALSATCGFRVFVPLFGIALSVRAGAATPLAEYQWVGSNAALAILGAATVLEILAYLIPIVDHALDLAAVPMATVAGTMLTGTLLTGEVNPALAWALGLIAGGTTAGATAAAIGFTRTAVTATTGGIGNPVFSLAESTLAVVGAFLALVAPVLALVLFGACTFGAIRLAQRLRRRKARKAAPAPELL